MHIDVAMIGVAVGLFNTLVMVGGGFFFMGSFSARVNRIESDIHDTKGLIVSAAVDASRISRVEADIHNLRRGAGWINDDKASGVSREY